MWYSAFLFALIFAPIPINSKITIISSKMFTFSCDGYTSVFNLGKEFYKHTPAAKYLRS